MPIIFQTNSILKILTPHFAAKKLYKPHFRGDFRDSLPGVLLSALPHKSSILRDLDDDPQHIALNHLQIFLAIGLALTHHVPHAGAQFIRQVNLLEKDSDDRILWEWGKGVWIKNPELMRVVAVFSPYLAALDDQPGWKGIPVLPVDQDIGGHFPEDCVPDADPMVSLQIKRVRQMLLDKGHDSFIALYDIGPDQVPVVKAVQVDLSEDKVSAVMVDSRENDPIIAQKEDYGQGQAAYAGLRIRLKQLGACVQLHVIHIQPGMAVAPYPGQPPAFVDQIRPQIIQSGLRVDLVFRVGGLLAGIQLRHEPGVIGDIQVAVFVLVVYAPPFAQLARPIP